MKVSKREPEFPHFDLTIRFQTQEEVDKFYALFDFIPVTEGLVLTNEDEAIRNALSPHTKDWENWHTKLYTRCKGIE